MRTKMSKYNIVMNFSKNPHVNGVKLSNVLEMLSVLGTLLITTESQKIFSSDRDGAFPLVRSLVTPQSVSDTDRAEGESRRKI